MPIVSLNSRFSCPLSIVTFFSSAHVFLLFACLQNDAPKLGFLDDALTA